MTLALNWSDLRLIHAPRITLRFFALLLFGAALLFLLATLFARRLRAWRFRLFLARRGGVALGRLFALALFIALLGAFFIATSLAFFLLLSGAFFVISTLAFCVTLASLLFVALPGTFLVALTSLLFVTLAGALFRILPLTFFVALAGALFVALAILVFVTRLAFAHPCVVVVRRVILLRLRRIDRTLVPFVR